MKPGLGPLHLYPCSCTLSWWWSPFFSHQGQAAWGSSPCILKQKMTKRSDWCFGWSFSDNFGKDESQPWGQTLSLAFPKEAFMSLWTQEHMGKGISWECGVRTTCRQKNSFLNSESPEPMPTSQSGIRNYPETSDWVERGWLGTVGCNEVQELLPGLTSGNWSHRAQAPSQLRVTLEQKHLGWILNILVFSLLVIWVWYIVFGEMLRVLIDF